MTQVETDKTYCIGMGPQLDGKIPPGDPYWHRFNGAFENQELTQLQIAERLYDGHAITTCCDPQWRKSENYDVGQHIGLDFDTEDEQSTFDHLMQDSFIERYGSLIHTTPSHTPAKPRARVIFLLDKPIHQAKNYTRAASALLWIWGAADPQCKDPVRFFYGCRPGAGEMEWLNHELPLDVIRDLIQRHEAAVKVQRRPRWQSNRRDEPADEARIREALDSLNPWSIDYSEWVSALMAIHSEMPGPTGESLAVSWADGKPGEVEKKWEGFDANGNSSGKVTIGTLFALAQQYGSQR